MSPELPTIFALASAPGRAGVAVVRVSGGAVRDCLERIAGGVSDPRRARLRVFRDPCSGDVIDRGLAIFFPGPASFTGEDMAEFHVHGGPAVVRAMVTALGRIPACRMAEPGEFARRAFLHGKLDLTAAEGLADLIDAETEAQRRQALTQASGALGQLYESWRSLLVEATALVEAGIDFADEGDVSSQAFELARPKAATLKDAIARHLDDGHRGEIVREGLKVVLAGPPNAGKSSLLNALARREAAIVSEEAGTTRDVIEVKLDIGGFAVVLADTAGIREAQGAIEREGLRRTFERVRQADAVLWLIDGALPVGALPGEVQAGGARVLKVLNKCDLLPRTGAARETDTLYVSARTGEGLDVLTARLGALAGSMAGRGEGPAITQVRHRQLLEACGRHLLDFLSGPASEVELRAEDLRLAAQALGRITGRAGVEEVLDQIFSRFCIGK